MYSWIYPLKIHIPKLAHYSYKQTELQYVIEFFDVEIYARKSLTRRNTYISLKDSKKRFLSPTLSPEAMQAGQTEVCYMKFDTDIMKENFTGSLLDRKSIKGRIVIGRCKSKFFDIERAISTDEL